MSYIATSNEHYRNRRFAESITTLENAIKSRGDFFVYHARLGELYLKKGDIVRARSCFEQVLKLNPAAHWARTRLSALPEPSQGARFCGIYDAYPDFTGKRQAEGGLRTKGVLKSSKPDLPLVTVVTAVYDNTETFQRCIDSVRAQSYPNVEYIVVDGGSGEGTLKIIQDNAEFIDYFISEPDAGIYSAMNKGIELARGEYVCLLNSDDRYDPEFIMKTTQAAEQGAQEADVVYTDYYANTTLLRAQNINSGIFFGHLHICHNTFLTRKSCYDRIGRYDEDFRIVSDAVWMRKAFMEGARFKRVSEPLFFLADGGLSSGDTEEKRNLFISEVVASYKASYPFLSENEAREIYLFRFNSRRASALIPIIEKNRSNAGFSEASRRYVEHCLRDRGNFLLDGGADADGVRDLFKLVDATGADLSCVQLKTKHGLLSDVLGRIDSIIGLRKKNAQRTILHFVTVFSAPPETFIYDVLRRLDNETKNDNFILFEYEQFRAARPYAKAIHVAWADFPPGVATQIYKYIFDALRPDVIIGHFALNEWKLAARMKPLRLSIPTISMTHGIDAFALRDKPDYNKYILDEFCSRSDTMFTAVSEYLKAELLSHGIPDEKIALVHNAVDERFFEHRKTKDFYDGSRTLKLLSVGRLIQLKGHAYLIRGLKAFMGMCTRDVHLTIVYGHGADIRDSLEALINDLELSGHVSFVPFVNFNEQPDYFAGFDCFVHPSTYSDDQYQRSETFGVSLLEAISAGLPVITTDAGGLPEVLGEDRAFAEVVPHGDSEAIAAALAKFWHTRNAFSDNRPYAEDRLKRFSARAQIAALCELITKVAPIRAALFSSSTVAGAGYAAYRLHKGFHSLTSHSVVSDMFTTTRNHEKEPAVHVVKHPSSNIHNWRFLQPAPKPEHTIFTVNQPNFLSSDLIAMTDRHDVINLHWHARFLSVENIASLTRAGKPVVLTLRDMFPITGGCHSFHGCDRWKDDCSDCPQIPSVHKGYPAKVLAAKRRHYDFSNLTIVTLSNHSRRIVESAPFFNSCRLEVIPNSIETDVFRPYDKMAARRKLGLPPDRPIIGYVPSYSSSVKGYREIVEALDILKEAWPTGDPFVMLVGEETPATSMIKFDNKSLGYISDNAKLAEVFSAADVVVVPSLEETFSNTTAEAISCGVPVVGFRTGAIPELVLDGRTGYTYEVGDSRGLAAGIKLVLTGPNLAANCRAHAVSYLRFLNQAERYEALYGDLLAQSGNRLAENQPKVFEFFEELGQDQFGIALEKHGA